MVLRNGPEHDGCAGSPEREVEGRGHEESRSEAKRGGRMERVISSDNVAWGSLRLSSSGFVLSLGTFPFQQEANPALWRWGWDSFQAQQLWGDGDRNGASH